MPCADRGKCNWTCPFTDPLTTRRWRRRIKYLLIRVCRRCCVPPSRKRWPWGNLSCCRPIRVMTFFAQFPNCLPYASNEEFVGNMYYAMTHSPEPLTEEYAHALSWEAATERFMMAGSISVDEALAAAEALSSGTDLEISLPSGFTRLTATIRQTRARYRKFRSKLSAEIRDANVLPAPVTNALVSELDKRLDLDLDQLLTSPKLRFKLSPAELDETLLDIYNKVSESPSGDVLRVIGGGTDVGWQKRYLWRQKWSKRRNELLQQHSFLGGGSGKDGQSAHLSDMENNHSDADDKDLMPAEWVSRALYRNLPSMANTKYRSTKIAATKADDTTTATTAVRQHHKRGKEGPRMALLSHGRSSTYPRGEAIQWRGATKFLSLQPRICTSLRMKVR
mmetsp:Transcript_47371/g.57358  ORF Transcript_47371/g.57358 Transcript_47371/m.57358 type:complete len:393 (-) Transcript_47371:183-1361(-)